MDIHSNIIHIFILLITLVGCSGGDAGLPELPIEAGNIISISSFNDGSCAVLANQEASNGRLYCWGAVNSRFSQSLSNNKNYLARPTLISHEQGIREVAVGAEHLCVINANIELWCMGNDTSGALGIASNQASFDPSKQYLQLTRITAASDWKLIATGGNSSCGIKEGGSLLCWGNNLHRQLATNGIKVTVTEPSTIYESANLVDRSSWIKISLNSNHSCGIKSDGSLWCWGDSRLGRLAVPTSTPVDVAYPTEVIKPAAVANLKWLAITTGSGHSCGIIENQAAAKSGSIWCWGNNESGQVGQSFTLASNKVINTVTQLNFGQDWVSVSARGDSTCAVNSSKQMYCWGRDSNVVPASSLSNNSSRPILVGTSNDKNWIDIATDTRHRCAVKSYLTNNGNTASNVWCWGNNDRGQLGLGGTSESNQPVEVYPAKTDFWNGVALGAQHACGTKRSGDLFCWGGNLAGQLGIGNFNHAYTPATVITADLESWGQYDSYANHTCGVYYSYEVNLPAQSLIKCWGDSNGYRTTASVDATIEATPSIINLKPLDWRTPIVGRYHSCIKDKLSNLYCWGNNTAGQVGKIADVTNRNITLAVKINIPGEINTVWRNVDAGDETMCGRVRARDSNNNPLANDNSLWCWGNTNDWQFMDPTLAKSNTKNQAYSELPVQILPTTSQWFAVAVGQRHVCAITRDTKQLFCWGDNIYGTLGVDNSLKPSKLISVNDRVLVNTASDNAANINTRWRSVSSHKKNTCAVTSDFNLWCWGSNGSGNVGNGTISDIQWTPVQVLPANAWINASVSSEFVCASKKVDGSLWCWGKNDVGQLGNGNTFTSNPIKVRF